MDETECAIAWIEAWNAHDLDAILDHYAPDVEFASPIAAQRMGQGRQKGVAALRAYWAAGLASQPDLHFTLKDVLVGHEAVTLLYTNHLGRLVAETHEFNAAGKIARAYACYAPLRPAV